MTIYRAQTHKTRCVICRKYDLPCNDAVHANELFPYVPLVETTMITADMVPVAPGHDTPAVERRDPTVQRAKRARTLSTVALVVVMLAAAAVILGAYALIFHADFGGHPCLDGPCAPVQYATAPAAPPTLPPPPTR